MGGTKRRTLPAQDSWDSVDMGHGRRRVRRGMVLPFSPVTLTFRDVHYYVDLPRVGCLP